MCHPVAAYLGAAHVDDRERVEVRQRDARLDETLRGSGDVGELPLPLPGAGDGLRVALHPVRRLRSCSTGSFNRELKW